MKLLLTLICLGISLCSFAQTVEPYVSSISKAKAAVESNIELTPYKEDQQTIFKNYFFELSEFINDINGSNRLSRRFGNYNSSNGVSSLCKNLFLDKSLWESLVTKCTKNRFFLCAEEVKAFDLYKQSLKKLLTEAQQEEFSKLTECE